MWVESCELGPGVVESTYRLVHSGTVSWFVFVLGRCWDTPCLC